MKRLHLIILLAAVTLSGMAQTVGEAFYIYRNDGQFNAFFRDEVDSIAYSHYDADSVYYNEYVTQLVYTPDSLYRIPLAVIDSIGFVQPETIYKEDVKPIVGGLFDYLIKVDNLDLTFDPSIPTSLLPNVGDKLVATDLTDKLPLGFTGLVRQVQSAADGFVISCDSLDLSDAVDQFYGVVEMVGQEGDGSVRRYLRRKAMAGQSLPFRFNIPTIDQKIDLTPLVKPKNVYDINGKAVATATIKPVMTGKITRVIDNLLHIDHYNIHAETYVTTATQVEVAGEAANSDNPLSLNSSDKQFLVEGTKPGPYGIPIYYALGPKFDLSGQIALGTTVYADFTRTDDITFSPLATAIGIVVPGLASRYNTVSSSIRMTHFDVDWAYIAGSIEARLAVCGRLGIGLAAKGGGPGGKSKNLGWVGVEAQIGAKATAELGFDFEALSNAEKGTAFYDGLKDKAKIVVMPYWGLEAKLSVVDDRYQFTFLGRDYYTFWGKKWEWDLLPIFSDTKGVVSNGSSIEATADIANDCILPVTVGFSLFDESGNRIGSPQWNDQKFHTRADFSQPLKTTFTSLASDLKYKVYPTLSLFGYPVLCSPSADVEMKFPVELSDFKVTKSQYQQNGFSHDGRQYDYRFDVSITATLDGEAEGLADWGYAYLDPYGNEALISLKSFGYSYTDTRYAYFRNEAKSTCTLYCYVKYAGSDEPVYGEPHDYLLEHKGETSCPDANHPHWIDMGLPSGTQWRCCNEGASTPEAFGGYYQFGQVSSAPTIDQIRELLNYCSYTWTTQNGVNGGKFTGPNGGTIFLPAAGYPWDGELGLYWSSTLYAYDPDLACSLRFSSGGAIWDVYYRYDGRTVRPVR